MALSTSSPHGRPKPPTSCSRSPQTEEMTQLLTVISADRRQDAKSPFHCFPSTRRARHSHPCADTAPTSVRRHSCVTVQPFVHTATLPTRLCAPLTNNKGTRPHATHVQFLLATVCIQGNTVDQAHPSPLCSCAQADSTVTWGGSFCKGPGTELRGRQGHLHTAEDTHRPEEPGIQAHEGSTRAPPTSPRPPGPIPHPPPVNGKQR